MSKLEWSRAAESERQLRDATRVAEVTGAKNLQIEYLRKWAVELGVTDLLEGMLATLPNV